MIVRCPNGHYYDDRKYQNCPHCKIDLNAFLADGGRRGMGSRSDESKTLAFDAPDESKTLSFSDPDDDQVTISFYEKSMKAEPVVGWLVAMSGPEMGRDFRIKAGRNSIGRANSNDIAVNSDPRISKKKHAEVIYDHRSNRTFLAGGNSMDLMAGGSVVTDPVEIHDGERITIGETEFIFSAFCRGDITWDAFINKDNNAK